MSDETPATTQIISTESGSTSSVALASTPVVPAIVHSVEVSSRWPGVCCWSFASVIRAKTKDTAIATVPIQPAARPGSRLKSAPIRSVPASGAGRPAARTMPPSPPPPLQPPALVNVHRPPPGKHGEEPAQPHRDLAGGHDHH